MSSYSIRTENLSKKYYIGKNLDTPPEPILQRTKNLVLEPFRRLRSMQRSQMPQFADDSIWALRNINIDIQQGEVVGIIGHNGAGKSTLLKILSRITLPTSGRARIWGRVAALLEVGTGFHQELTGRENVYLNGTILGMSKSEVDRKLDAIVDFAGVEQYLDTPVKRYSSGMRVRLGFSVAAHLEPDILLVDEVLAVGDLAFQRRSLGKMDEAAKSGRTVVFISHNMQTISNLCPRAIWLDHGQVAADGETLEVIKQYTEASIQVIQNLDSLDGLPRKGDGSFRFQKIELLNAEGEHIKSLAVGETLRVRVHYWFDPDLKYTALNVLLMIRHETKGIVTVLSPNYIPDWEWHTHQGTIEATIEHLPWVPGTYFLDVRAGHDNETSDKLKSVATLNVVHGNFYQQPILIDKRSLFLSEQQWTIKNDT